jgi:hypothetical protein
MNKKLIILVLALVLPGLIFLFLKIFGNNQFDIPVYYKDGLEGAPTECLKTSKGQYVLPDSLLDQVKWHNGAALWFTGASLSEMKELKRALENIKPADVQFINLDSLQLPDSENIKKCKLLLKNPWNAVLTDSQKRIRGYYSLTSREELDRLAIEIEILLKK